MISTYRLKTPRILKSFGTQPVAVFVNLSWVTKIVKYAYFNVPTLWLHDYDYLNNDNPGLYFDAPVTTGPSALHTDILKEILTCILYHSASFKWPVLPVLHWNPDARHHHVNSLRPRLNRRPFADDILKCIFLNENEWNLPRISLKFVPKVRNNNIPTLVQIMAWRRPGDKPLSEPMMVSLLTHICVTRPQWVNRQFLVFYFATDYGQMMGTFKTHMQCACMRWICIISAQNVNEEL